MNKCFLVDPGDEHAYMLLVVAPSEPEAMKFGTPLHEIQNAIAKKLVPALDLTAAGAWRVLDVKVTQHRR